MVFFAVRIILNLSTFNYIYSLLAQFKTLLFLIAFAIIFGLFSIKYNRKNLPFLFLPAFFSNP